MKIIPFFFCILFIYPTLYGQNIFNVDLIKSTIGIKVNGCCSSNDANGQYELDFSKGGVINIVSHSFIKKVPIVIQNNTGEAVFVLRNKSFKAKEVYYIEFDTSGKSLTRPGTTSKKIGKEAILSIGSKVYKFRFKASSKPNIKLALQKTMLNPNTATSESYQPTGLLLLDALTLYKVYKRSFISKDTIFSILSYYANGNETEDVFSQWEDVLTAKAFADNGFISEFIKLAKEKDVSIEQPTFPMRKTKIMVDENTVSEAKGLDFPVLPSSVNETITFPRSKGEFSTDFFDHFKKEMNEQRELQILFPKTYQCFNSTHSELYTYSGSLEAFRECFKHDLSSLPFQFSNILTLDNMGKDIPTGSKTYLQTAFFISNMIAQKEHLGNIIERVALEGLDTLVDRNLKMSWNATKLISQSIKGEPGKERYWANDKDLKKLFSDEILLKIYLGLLEQRSKNERLVFYDSSGIAIPFSKIIESSYSKQPNGLSNIKYYFNKLAEKVGAIEAKCKDKKSIYYTGIQEGVYYQYGALSSDLLDFLLNLSNFPQFPSDSSNKEQFGLLNNCTHTAIDMVIDVNLKNYHSEILDLCHLYNMVMNSSAMQEEQSNYNKSNNKDSLIAENKTSYNVKIKKKGKKQIKSNVKENNSKQSEASLIENDIFRFGSFMATISEAKNGVEANQAVEAAALPAGKLQIKRGSPFNVGASGYAGFFGGYESINGNDEKFGFNTYGLTIPIGFNFSWASKKGFSRSIMFSILDLGTFAALRLKDHNTKEVPNLQLQNIFAPGFIFSYGIPKLPLSFNVGCQFGTCIRDGIVNGYDLTNNSYIRWSTSICVDLPSWNFYTRSKK